ncbi:MAG: hypothetical protein DRP02_02420 [Candidatus Gerdarchaeota archaeon]|nr:MAG: hypothetical protein DRP02_02420 [Candidatus Gerdarchaeota archaeon]
MIVKGVVGSVDISPLATKDNQTNGDQKTQIVDSNGDTWNLEQNGAMPVNIQDQHSRALDLRFIKANAAPTTLSVAASEGDLSVTVTSTAGFVDGASIAIFTPDGDFYFGEQVGDVAGNVVTLDTPIDTDYPIGSSALAANHHMNVDGSGTTQIFQIGPVGGETGVEIDITRIMGNISNGTAMDDGTFAGLDPLPNGVVLRVNNGIMTNIWNVKTNGALGLLCFDAAYTTKAPAGENGFRFRNTYAGQSKHGVTLRLEAGDILEVLIQDDLTDLTDFQMMAQGHVVTD